MRSIERDPYALCPCGSGRKYKFCCRERERREQRAGLHEIDAPAGERVLVMDLERGEREQEMGLECLQAGHTDAAIRHFERAIDAAPAIPSPHNNLATAHYMAGDLTRAVAVSEHVTRDVHPANVFALANQVHFHLLLGHPEQARACAERMQRLEPHDATAHAKRCEALARLCDHAALLADARDARADDPTQEAAFAFYAGVAAANLARYDEAATHLARATDHPAHGHRARRYVDLLRRRQGPGTLDGDWPYLESGHWVSPEVIRRQLPKESAAPPLPGLIHPLRAMLSGDSAEERNVALDCLARLGTDEARAVLRRVAFGSFGDDALRVHAHSLLLAAGDRAVQEKAPMYLRGRWSEGRGYEIEVTEEIPSPLPPELHPRMEAIVLAGRAGDWARSERLARELDRQAPGVPWVLHNLATALLAQGRRAGAEPLLVRAIAADTEYVFAPCTLALLRLRDGRVEEARAVLAGLKLPARLHPDAAVRFFSVVSEVALAAGDLEEAAAARETLRQFEPVPAAGATPEKTADDPAPPRGMLKRIAKALAHLVGRARKQRERQRRRLLTADADTETTLVGRDRQALLDMARYLGLARVSALNRQELARALADALTDPAFLACALRQVEPRARAALQELVAEGGVAPHDEFAPRHDVERAKVGEGAGAGVGAMPSGARPDTPLGQLLAFGLATECTVGGRECVLVPADLRAGLAELLARERP